MKNMKTHLLAAGVDIKVNEKVIDLEIKNGVIGKVMTNQGSYRADEYILAAGSWTGLVAKKLGMKLLLQAGKGYRINVESDTNISLPAILVEAKAAVTPMNGFTRFAGTMEIAGINDRINPVRVKAIAKAARDYYQQVSITTEEMNNASSGLRPLSPDGVPYIGRTKNCSNLTIATGHAMMGWTMATGTGKLVSEIISDSTSSLKLDAFSPDRTF
mgnify:FL=1